MKLITSNETKLKEFQRILPEIESVPGTDLKEILGSPEEIVLYKSLAAGEGFIVEDTILLIEGKEVVDIKWKIDELKNFKSLKEASWQVIIGYNNGIDIELYKGIINGVIVPDSSDKGYGFDPYFLPDGSDITLAVLESEGKKDSFSARQQALLNLKNRKIHKKIQIETLPVWQGKYQIA
jgi:XTP/dITP diphosphohydrolase